MKSASLFSIAALTLSLLSPAGAHDYEAGTLHIAHPWARATVPGQPAGGAYLELENRGGADRLLSARSPASARVELHSMTMEGEVMRMRELEAVPLPAGATVKFQPGGLHLMLMGLKAPLKQGERVPLTLRFEKAGEVTVELSVESPGSMGGRKPEAPAPDHAHHHHP